MSIVLDLRKKTTQERLRSDHIDLLMKLDSSLKENESLALEIKRLEKVIESLQKRRDDLFNNNDISPQSDNSLQIQIEELNNQIISQQTEIKTLFISMDVLKKSHFKKIEEMSQAILTERSANQNLALEQCNILEEISLLRLKLQSYENQETQRINENNILQQELFKAHSEISNLQNSNAELNKQLITTANESNSMILSLKGENIDLVEKAQEFELIANKRKEIIKKLENDVAVWQAKCHDDEKRRVSTSDCACQTQSEIVDKDEVKFFVTSHSENGELEEDISFSKYINLKRENILLKKQLADLHASNPRQGVRR